jgi:hypothetical protein
VRGRTICRTFWTGSGRDSGPVQLILNRFVHLNRTKTDTMLKDGVWTGVNFETCPYTCTNHGHPRHPLGRVACSWTGSKTVHRFKTPSDPVHREYFLVCYLTIISIIGIISVLIIDCFISISVHKNFKNHFYPDPTRFPGPQTKYCPGEDLSHFRHKNLTPDRRIKYRNKSFKSTRSSFMSDIMAETMVAEFKRLLQSAYIGGYTSRFGSRTHFQLATFSALMRTG